MGSYEATGIAGISVCQALALTCNEQEAGQVKAVEAVEKPLRGLPLKRVVDDPGSLPLDNGPSSLPFHSLLQENNFFFFLILSVPTISI